MYENKFFLVYISAPTMIWWKSTLKLCELISIYYNRIKRYNIFFCSIWLIKMKNWSWKFRLYIAWESYQKLLYQVTRTVMVNRHTHILYLPDEVCILHDGDYIAPGLLAPTPRHFKVPLNPFTAVLSEH